MQKIINISEEQMDMVRNSHQAIFADVYRMMADIIKNGTPLDVVLDKIRTEIVERQKEYHEYGWAYDDVLEIIDKYRAESEERTEDNNEND